MILHWQRKTKLPAPSPPLPAALSVEEQASCFVVRDHNGQALAYVYFEDAPGRRSATKLLEREEARRITYERARKNQSRPCPSLVPTGFTEARDY